MQKDVKKILLKLVQNGQTWLTELQIERLLAHSKTILDNQKQKQLSEDLKKVMTGSIDAERQVQQNWFYAMLLKLIKYYVIPPTEKNYIIQIEKELQEDEQLEREIQNIESQIDEQKKKKLQIYEMQKSGLRVVPRAVSADKQALNFDNKLMRVNQKLNQITCNNSKLRQKINQLRKEKNSMEQIYTKLKKQLQSKKENVENTIKTAGEAYCARNQAEEDLRMLKQQAETKKENFRADCTKLNRQIQHDIRFKQFIKGKQVQKEQLQQLEQQIRQNQQNISIKKESNFRIEEEYRKSVQKQAEIKKSFDRIKRHIGVSDSNSQQQGIQLFNTFLSLYQKNAVMKSFVEQLKGQVVQLQGRIQSKKHEIQQMYLKGSGEQSSDLKLNEKLKSKRKYQEKRHEILQNQYEKSVQTIAVIKQYLQNIFQEINADPDIIQKLRSCNISEDNLNYFLGELQRKGLQAISHYGKLVGQQLKAANGGENMEKQIKQLNNIITLDNVNLSNTNHTNSKITEYPSELLIKIKDEKCRQQDLQKPLSVQQLKKFAMESLQQFNKRQVPKQKHSGKKYNNMFSVLSNKSKKRAINS